MIVMFVVMTYRDLKDELLTTVVRLECIENRRKLHGIEFDCYHPSAS
jgi:hypothetical protein